MSYDSYQYESSQEFELEDDSGMPDEEERVDFTSDRNEVQILTFQDLMNLQQKEVDRISELMRIPQPFARILCRHFKWNTDKLVEKFIDRGPEIVYKEAGITLPTHTETQGENFKCEGCLEDTTFEQSLALGCGHRFCNDCWKGYLTVAIRDGQSKNVTCMAYKCKTRVDEETVAQFVEGDVSDRFTRSIIESFVDDNPKIKWCPSAPHCGNAISVSSPGSCLVVNCKCGLSFCFACCEEAHTPASCDMNKDWKKVCANDSMTLQWLSVNTKDCPKCKKAIEKNGGCNHMHCTGCDNHFCWLCLGEFNHATYSHTCNKYTEETGKQETSRASLDRYLFYFNRFKGHEDSAKLEKDTRERVAEKMVTIAQMNASTISGGLPTPLDWLEACMEKLFECRKLLMYSYVFAFYAFSEESAGGSSAAASLSKPVRFDRKDRLTKKMIFEDQQQQLENATERLSNHLEHPAEELIENRSQILDGASLADSWLFALLDVVVSDIIWDFEYGRSVPVFRTPFRLSQKSRSTTMASLARQSDFTATLAPKAMEKAAAVVATAPPPAPQEAMTEDEMLAIALAASEEDQDSELTQAILASMRDY